MDDNLYIIIIIGLCIFVMFYGGHNYQNKLEYDTGYFDNLNTVIYFENKLEKILKNISFEQDNMFDLTNYVKSAHVTLPNFIGCFAIKINSGEYFNIFKIIKPDEFKSNMMIIFNNSKSNDLELLVNNEENNLYQITKSSDIINNTTSYNSIGYFYELDKIISITDLYHIYNNSSYDVVITCFIIKKPFWHK